MKSSPPRPSTWWSEAFPQGQRDQAEQRAEGRHQNRTQAHKRGFGDGVAGSGAAAPFVFRVVQPNAQAARRA